MKASEILFHDGFVAPMPEPREHMPTSLQMFMAFMKNPLNLWARQHYEKPVIIHKSRFGTILVVNDPAAIRRVFLDNEENYHKDPTSLKILRRVSGQSLFVTQGQRWRAQRKAVAPFFAPASRAGYIPAMLEAAHAGVENIRNKYGNNSFDILNVSTVIALDAMQRSIFSYALPDDIDYVSVTTRTFADRSASFGLTDLLRLPVWFPEPRAWRSMPYALRLRQIISTTIARHKRSEPRSALLSRLFSATLVSGAVFSPREIRDNIGTLVGAGHETTGLAVTWAIYLLAHSPNIRTALENEARDVFASDNDPSQIFSRLVLTRAVIEEAMRLYPPAPLLSRVAVADDSLANIPVRKGTIVMVAPWLVHRNHQIWENPDEFRPERFLPQHRDAIPRFAYLPFGAGPRLCVGMQFGLMSATIILAALTRTFRFELDTDRPIRLIHRVTLAMEGGLAVIARNYESDLCSQ